MPPPVQVRGRPPCLAVLTAVHTNEPAQSEPRGRHYSLRGRRSATSVADLWACELRSKGSNTTYSCRAARPASFDHEVSAWVSPLMLLLTNQLDDVQVDDILFASSSAGASGTLRPCHRGRLDGLQTGSSDVVTSGHAFFVSFYPRLFGLWRWCLVSSSKRERPVCTAVTKKANDNGQKRVLPPHTCASWAER